RTRYQAFQRKEGAEALLRGIRWARNRVAHQFNELLYIAGGATMPLEIPPVFFEYKWKPSTLIPPPDKTRHNTGKADYDALLAGGPARFAVRKLGAFFARAAKEVP